MIKLHASCDCCSEPEDRAVVEYDIVADRVQMKTTTCNGETIVYLKRSELIKVLGFLK